MRSRRARGRQVDAAPWALGQRRVQKRAGGLLVVFVGNGGPVGASLLKPLRAGRPTAHPNALAGEPARRRVGTQGLNEIVCPGVS